ncbi:hypothetical protein ACMX2H_11475 [Arthrobacter sulfonylureivorans]|uniref:hypothetical protein n=1 Tax=Arthrobacter sulfonylureivorans TaxID=2486855 RepID=UPI0039E654CE
MTNRHFPLFLAKPMDPHRTMQGEDSQQWAVYAAEQSIKPGRQFGDTGEVQQFIDDILASRAWQERFPRMKKVEVSGRKGVDDHPLVGRRTYSYGGPRGRMPYAEGMISLHENMGFETVVLHELAHCVSPQFVGDPSGVKKGALGFNSPQHGHGPYFRASFSWLCEHFGSDGTHSELWDAYRHYQVPAAPVDELWKALEQSAHWEGVLQAMHDEEEPSLPKQPEADGQRDAPGAAALGAPGLESMWWGSFLWEARVLAHRTTKTEVARRVSLVTRCKTADVTRIENYRQPPEDPAERLLAFQMGVVLGADPRWMLTAQHLFRMELGARMKDLEKLNRHWVAHVRWMNRALRQRPPYWRVSGHR